MASRNKRSKFAIKKSVKHYSDKLCGDLFSIIETLTHSGNKTLNENELNEMRNICKRSDMYVKEAFDMVMENLKEKHAEVRFSALQISDEMFRRSHRFRELVVSNLEQVVELTMGKTLPPPTRVAKELKELAVRSLHQWNATFGKSYKKLAIGYEYLLRTDKAAFKILEETDTSSQEANNRHQELINRLESKNIIAEIKDKEMDINTSVTAMSNCINLLLPHPDDFFIMSEEDGVDDLTQHHSSEFAEAPSISCDSDGEENLNNTGLREVGISGVNHSVELDFTPSSEVYVKETPENSDIILNLREAAKLIKNKYLPTVNTWLETLVKSSENKEERNNLVKLKGDMDDVLFKYNRMVFVTGDDVSSDSDLEEVEVARPTSPSNQSKESDLKTESVKSEPSTSEGAVSRKEKLLAIAPKRPFDVDLYHWEDEKLPVPTMISSSTEGHRFWVGADSSLEEIPVPEGSAALRTRVIEYTGNFSPVSHFCRVRLPSGKLCPRRDRYKCPFHGEIVPRDETGSCINPRDALRMQQLAEKRQQERPDWQDPKLLAEIKRTTGIDLKMPEKGKRKKKERKHPGLTDLKQLENNPKKRLEKKIFKKASMKRVATAMDRLDQRKFTDKFGDQFNYFYD